jgi:hypothetical protein
MKNKNFILNFFKTTLILSLPLSANCSYASEINYNNYSDIHNYVSAEAKGLMREYKSSKPLDAEIFDSTDDSIKNFLQGTSQIKADNLLAIQYFPKLAVNGLDMSFCFLFYDSKKNIFQQYKDSVNMSEDEILQYLTWHEMGHCFAKHEGFNINTKTNEFIADAFAMSIAINKQQTKLPTKIIKFINTLDINDIHSNKTELEKFLIAVLDGNIFNKKLSVNEIINIIRYYQEHSGLVGYK